MVERDLNRSPLLARPPHRQAQVGLRSGRDRIFRWIALATVIATYALIVFGGIVRVTGSGLGCPDWPLCHGRLIPPLDGPTLIEYTHRLITTAVTPLVLLTAALAWRWYRQMRSIVVPALAAVALLVVQIVLGGITVLTELQDSIVSLHLGNAMLLFAALVFVAARTFQSNPANAMQAERRNGYRNLALVGAGATFALIVIGAMVRGSGAGPACIGFPACNGQLIPQNWLGQLHMLHRLAAVIVGLLVGGIMVQTWRIRRSAGPLMVVASVAGLVFVAQFAVGIAQVTIGLRPALRALHLALATGLWGTLVVLAALVLRSDVGQCVVATSVARNG